MINRKDRNNLKAIINSYLNQKIASFTFDDWLIEIKESSKDKTVLYIIDSLWYFYDDIKDHKIAIDKEGWDYIQRLLLVLESDREILVKEKKIFTIRQWFSFVLLVLFIVAYIYFSGFIFICISSVIGVLSMVISEYSQKEEQKYDTMKFKLTPFSSISELSKSRKEQKNFKKVKYNRDLEENEIRSEFMYYILLLHSKLYWLIYPIFVLFFQLLPEKRTKIRVF